MNESVAFLVEKYEVVTITKVGKPGVQDYLTADAKAGETNIKVSSVADISVGDRIRLDIDSKGHGIEWVTVTHVGTPTVRKGYYGPITDLGTGLDLAAPLKFNHSDNLPFSDRGTGISFEPALAFPTASNQPVLPLGTGIRLNRPLAGNYAINAAVRDQKVLTAGYQGSPAPNQWFGGPALSPSAGSMVLRDAAGKVVDGLNYGGMVDPWVGEGYQGASGPGASGCYAPVPTERRGFGFFGRPAAMPDLSAGRYPDGTDNNSNCEDFHLQNTTTLAAESTVGSDNIKVASVGGFDIGQKIIIDRGANRETAVIAFIGTPGGTTLSSATNVGATEIAVPNAEGFHAGQTITVDNGASRETATVASVFFGRPRFDNGKFIRPVDSITVAEPLTIAHESGAQVSGSGITLTGPLTRAHDDGAQVVSNLPTPGEPNQYFRKQ